MNFKRNININYKNIVVIRISAPFVGTQFTHINYTDQVEASFLEILLFDNMLYIYGCERKIYIATNV